MSSKSRLDLDSPDSPSSTPPKAKKGAAKERKGKEEQKAVAPKGKGAKKENQRPKSKSKSVTKSGSPDKKRGHPSKSKERSASKGKKGKQPQESASPSGKAKSPLKKLSKDVDTLKGKKPSKEEAKKSSKSAPGEDYQTQPKGAVSAYIYYNTATVRRLKEEDGLDHKAAFVKSGELWNSISAKEKAHWEAEAAKDLARFEREKKELEEKGFFMTVDGIKSTDLPVDAKKKWGKDTVMPKAAKSGYNYFTADKVATIKEKHNCKQSEAMKMAGEEWSKMSEKEKRPYEQRHKAD